MMNKALLLLSALAVFFSFFMLGHVPLFDVDEAVFSEATREMTLSGDWITPTYNGEKRYDKPILFYWLMALSYKVFGINELGARFVSAVSSLLLAMVLFFFVRRVCDEEKAFYASVSFILSLYFLMYSHAAVTDMALTLFISLSLFSFYLWSGSGDKGEPKNAPYFLYGFYLFSSLAFLTKGLIGIIFPFGIALLYVAISSGWNGVRKMISLKGMVLFLLVGAPWYTAQFAINGREFFDEFIVKHHFRRYTEMNSGHRGPFFYYLLTLLAGLFPWIVFLPSGIRNAVRGRHKPLLFSLLWFLFVVVFFSISSTKLPNYVLPAVPALCILIASGISGGERNWDRNSKLCLALLSLLAGTAFALSRGYLLRAGIADVEWALLLSLSSGLMTVLALYSAFSRKNFFIPAALIMALSLVLVLTRALPIAGEKLQGALHRYSLLAGELLKGDERIITFRINNPSIVFYSGHNVARVNSREELMPLLAIKGRLISITKVSDTKVLEEAGFRVLERSESYAILERE